MKLGKSRNVKLTFNLNADERQVILSLLSKGSGAARVLRRAQILKLFDDGYTSPKISEIIGITAVNVRRIGWRYKESGLEKALYDLPRPGVKRLLSENESQRIIALACSSPPEGFARWTVRLLTEKAIKTGIVQTVGRETIRILLKTHDLKPWREKNVVRSRNNS